MLPKTKSITVSITVLVTEINETKLFFFRQCHSRWVCFCTCSFFWTGTSTIDSLTVSVTDVHVFVCVPLRVCHDTHVKTNVCAHEHVWIPVAVTYTWISSYSPPPRKRTNVTFIISYHMAWTFVLCEFVVTSMLVLVCNVKITNLGKTSVTKL